MGLFSLVAFISYLSWITCLGADQPSMIQLPFMATEAPRNIFIKTAKKLYKYYLGRKCKGYDQSVQLHGQCSFSLFLKWGRCMKLGKSVQRILKLGKVETCLKAKIYSNQELK